MLFDLVVFTKQTTLDHIVKNTRTSDDGPTYHLIVPPGLEAYGATATDRPWESLKTRRMIVVEQPVRVASHWEAALLYGLNGGNNCYRAVPSLSVPGTPEQRSPLEQAYPDVWQLPETVQDDRMRYFNRCCRLMTIEDTKNEASAPVWAADTLGPPPWERPTLIVQSAVVDNR